jgi:hypothetical protein
MTSLLRVDSRHRSQVDRFPDLGVLLEHVDWTPHADQDRPMAVAPPRSVNNL